MENEITSFEAAYEAISYAPKNLYNDIDVF